MSFHKQGLITFVYLGLCLGTKVQATSVSNHLLNPQVTKEEAPWFTGPLLAPSAHTIPPGHVNIEPYSYFFVSEGIYDQKGHFRSGPHFYTLVEQVPIQIGINSFMDCQIAPQLLYQFTRGERSVQPGDLPISLGFLLLDDTPGTWHPAIKLSLKASIPFGKYENLSAAKLFTDGVGTGSWMPGVGINISRLYLLYQDHFLSPRLSFNYQVPCTVPVEGLSVYGGALDTRGKVYGGNVFWCDLGLEYNLTRSWTLAMDVFYQHTDKIKFSGNPGLFSVVGRPAAEALSLAPALEYNWNINVGVIAGVWFTVMGKNASAFTTAVVALNVYL